MKNNRTNNTANLFGCSSLVSPIVLQPNKAGITTKWKDKNWRKENYAKNKDY